MPGGTTAKFLQRLLSPPQEPVALGVPAYSISTLRANASGVPKTSAMTEWSITSSAGIRGLTSAGSSPESRPWPRASRPGRRPSGRRWCRGGTSWTGSGRRPGVVGPAPQSSRSWTCPAVTWSPVLVAQQVLQHHSQAVGKCVDVEAGEAVDLEGLAPTYQRRARVPKVSRPFIGLDGSWCCPGRRTSAAGSPGCLGEGRNGERVDVSAFLHATAADLAPHGVVRRCRWAL